MGSPTTVITALRGGAAWREGAPDRPVVVRPSRLSFCGLCLFSRNSMRPPPRESSFKRFLEIVCVLAQVLRTLAPCERPNPHFKAESALALVLDGKCILSFGKYEHFEKRCGCSLARPRCQKVPPTAEKVTFRPQFRIVFTFRVPNIFEL